MERFELFQLEDYHGNYLCTRVGANGLLEIWPSSSDKSSYELLLCKFRRNDVEQSFLFSPHSASFDFAYNLESVEREGGCVALRCPSSGLYLCSDKPRSTEAFKIECARAWIKEWETYRLIHIDPDDGTRRLIAKSIALVVCGSKRDMFRAAIESGDTESINLLQGVQTLFSDKNFNEISELLSSDGSIFDKLCSLHIADPYFNYALSPLITAKTKHASCRLPERVDVGSEFDFLNLNAWGREISSFWHGINAAIRAAVEPKRNICVLATARNEGIYLCDWIAYNLSMGVEHFFIYTNDNEDLSDELMMALSKTGLVTWLRNEAVPRGAAAQNKAYAHALTVLPDILDFHWCAIIDIDEFIAVDPELGDISDMLSGSLAPQADAVMINVIEVGSSDEPSYVEKPLTGRCHRFVSDVLFCVKSIIRPSSFVHSSPHVPSPGRNRSQLLTNASGGPFEEVPESEFDNLLLHRAFSKEPLRDTALVYHYFYKSAEEYLWKTSRNRGDYPKTEGEIGIIPEDLAKSYMDQRGVDLGNPPWMDLRLEKMTGKLKQLIADPDVERALKKVRMRYMERMNKIYLRYSELDEADKSPNLKSILADAEAMSSAR